MSPANLPGQNRRHEYFETVLAANKVEHQRLFEESEAEHGPARRLYAREDGHPVLRPSVVTFADELGTKVQVKNLGDDELAQQLAILREMHFRLKKKGGKNSRFMSFSDSIVIGVPLEDHPWRTRELSSVVTAMSSYQLGMTLPGLFVRGGISIGQLYMDDQIVTGQGLVDAVDLEQNVAVYPRVLLSNEALDEVLGEIWDNHVEYPGEDSPWHDMLLLDADGRAFVNYLLANGDLWSTSGRALTAHRNLIVDRLREFAEPSKVRDKYLWAADYHNHICREHFSAFVSEVQIVREIEGPHGSRFPRVFRPIPKPHGQL